MRALTLSCLLMLLAGAAFAALQFPALSGRVVDDAHVLSPGVILRLNQMLADYENGTTNQVVVVTLPSLQGTTIEDYGYQLGRKWGIGQKGKDNGVLLIVAPTEHKVRIEVGYGLEGTLTDAASSQIIHTIILPQFHAGQMEEGIVEGTKAILSVLGGTPLPAPPPSNHVSAPEPMPVWAGWALILLVAIFFIYSYYRAPQLNTSRFATPRLYMGGFGGLGGGFGGGGFGGGGFSGGGGGFGGGGASGGW